MDLKKSLITPPGMLVAVAVLAIYGLYAAGMAWLWKSPWHAGLALVSLVACVGTALVKPWSRYLVYLLTAGFVGGWLHSIYAGAVAGYFTFAFESWTQVARSLLPGLVMVLLSSACSWYVYRHFRGR